MKRFISLLNIVLVINLLVGGCTTPAPEVNEKVVTQVVEAEKEVTRVVEKVVTATPVPTLLHNIGFETGDLSDWITGKETEGVSVVGVEFISEEETEEIETTEEPAVAVPFEGGYMARLGSSHFSSLEEQPQGGNEMWQDFMIDSPTLTFAYNLWTFDYTGFDFFRYELRLLDTGEIIESFQDQATGLEGDAALRATGWQVVYIDTSKLIGCPARLYLSAGASENNNFGTWVYIDSAESFRSFETEELLGWEPTETSAELYGQFLQDYRELEENAKITFPAAEVSFNVIALNRGEPTDSTHRAIIIESDEGSALISVELDTGEAQLIFAGIEEISLQLPIASQPVAALQSDLSGGGLGSYTLVALLANPSGDEWGSEKDKKKFKQYLGKEIEKRPTLKAFIEKSKDIAEDMKSKNLLLIIRGAIKGTYTGLGQMLTGFLDLYKARRELKAAIGNAAKHVAEELVKEREQLDLRKPEDKKRLEEIKKSLKRTNRQFLQYGLEVPKGNACEIWPTNLPGNVCVYERKNFGGAMLQLPKDWGSNVNVDFCSEYVLNGKSEKCKNGKENWWNNRISSMIVPYGCGAKVSWGFKFDAVSDPADGINSHELEGFARATWQRNLVNVKWKGVKWNDRISSIKISWSLPILWQALLNLPAGSDIKNLKKELGNVLRQAQEKKLLESTYAINAIAEVMALDDKVPAGGLGQDQLPKLKDAVNKVKK